MIDLTNPSLLIMTEFELIAAVAAFAAVFGMVLYDWLAHLRRKAQNGDGGSEP